ncbi:transcription factor bHLH144-like [Cornus florida]|uniref:transcription factor bHLH144-like n=1 Tax=Cornus florida TaxID=4283 RepID=UPI00289DBE12|nr:transcription factor bHLH144-like [Cornus florida]
MQSDPQFFPQKPMAPLANQVGGNYINGTTFASAFGTVLPPGVEHRPLNGVEFQPSEFCPKNFIIFDQTDNRSQIMFHPAVAPKFCYPGLNIHASYIQGLVEKKDAHNEEREVSSSLNEDSDDIDALLSFEEEEQEESDQEEVSTARTHGNYGSESPDSCSNYGSKPSKSRLPSLQKSSGSGSSCNRERKRKKMMNMVKTLRGIIPGGGNRMNTVAVIDEAVRYLKSLKVEMKKLGVKNLKNEAGFSDAVG